MKDAMQLGELFVNSIILWDQSLASGLAEVHNGLPTRPLP